MNTVFECDRVTLVGDNAGIQNASDSDSVTFSKIYDDPVVVSHTATDNGGQKVDDRVTNLTGSGCDIFAHEPDQQGHADNTHTYFVAESGVHETQEGHVIEAGTHSTKTAHWDDAWNGDYVNFENDWSSSPVVVATVNTHNNGLFATPAISNVTTDGFELSLLSEDVENTHVESIGWIAFPDSGAMTMDGVPVEAGSTSGSSATFSQNFSAAPDYVADNMGHDGTNGWVRGGATWTSTDIDWYDEDGAVPAPDGYIAVEPNSVIQGYDGGSFYSGTFNYTDDAPHNYFGEAGGFESDVNLQGQIDGFNRTVGYFDAVENSSYEDIFTGEFFRGNFSGTGDGKYVYLAFAAKWNEIPVWGRGGGTWIRKPTPDPNQYQLYVLKSDASNSYEEYFRLYYRNGDETSIAYIADPFVWKGWEEGSVTDAQIFGDSSNRTIWPTDRSGTFYGYDGLDGNGDPKNGGGTYAGTIDHRGTAHTPYIASTASLNTRTTGAVSTTSAVGTAETAGISPSSSRADVTVDSATVPATTSRFSTTVLSSTNSVTPTTGISTGVKIASGNNDVTAKGTYSVFHRERQGGNAWKGNYGATSYVTHDSSVPSEDPYKVVNEKTADESAGDDDQWHGTYNRAVANQSTPQGTEWKFSGWYKLYDESGSPNTNLNLNLWNAPNSWSNDSAGINLTADNSWHYFEGTVTQSTWTESDDLKPGFDWGYDYGYQRLELCGLRIEPVGVAQSRTATVDPSLTYDAPNNVTASRNNDTSITVSWDAPNVEADQFHVQMSRDGNGWTDPASGATTDASNTSLTVYDESDNGYAEVIGADSEFRFRVRAEGADTSSSYSYSGNVYTTPIPPHNPSVNRPDSGTVEITFSDESDIEHPVELERRTDTGSGYGSWNRVLATNHASPPGTFGAHSANNNVDGVYGAGNSSIYYEGEAVLDIGGRGLNIAHFDSNYNLITTATYDTYGSQTDADNLTSYINNDLSSGDIFIVAADDHPGHHDGSNLESAIQNRLLSNDIQEIWGQRTSWAIIATVDTTNHAEKYDRRSGNPPLWVTWSPSGSVRWVDEPQSDSRHQYRMRPVSPMSESTTGDWVYADYGNRNNVYFEDDFESGDLSAWDSFNPNRSPTVGTGSHTDTGISGADEGSYLMKGWGTADTEGSWAQKNLGDLSGETDVLVKCAFAFGSLDSGAESFGISWYDGSSWQNLRHESAKYNRQGWIEFQATVPNSWLSTDNRIRVGTSAATSNVMYGGDYFAVDRVVVSDILHEYTDPAAPTNPTTTDIGFHEMTLDWTRNSAFGGAEEFTRNADAGDSFQKRFNNPPWTWTGLQDDTTYEWYPSTVLHQDRNGSIESWPRSDGPTTTVTTLNEETSVVTTTASSTSFDPATPTTSLTTTSMVASSASSLESGAQSSAVGSGKAGSSTETATATADTSVGVPGDTSPAEATDVEATASTTTSTGRSVQPTSAIEATSGGDAVTGAQGSVTATSAASSSGDGSVQTIADGGKVVSNSQTNNSSATTTASSSSGLPRADTNTAVGVGSTTTNAPAAPTGVQATGVSSEETTTFSVGDTETATTEPLQTRADIVSRASVTTCDTAPRTGVASTTTAAIGSDKTVGTNSFGLASTVASVSASSFDGMLATPKAADPLAATTAVGETVTTSTSTRGVGLSGIAVEPIQQSITVDTLLGIGSPEGFSGGRTSIESSTREGAVFSTSAGGNVTSLAVSPALPTVYTQSLSLAATTSGETVTLSAFPDTHSQDGDVIVAGTDVVANGSATSISRSKTSSVTETRTARADLVVGLTPTVVTAETFLSPAYTQSSDSGLTATAGQPSTSEAATSTTAKASVTSAEMSPQEPTVDAQTTGVGSRPSVSSDTTQSAVLSKSFSETTTTTVALEETSGVYTTTTVKSGTVSQVQALPGFATTTATAIINAIDGMVASPVVSNPFTETTADADPSYFDALGKNRLDPMTASVAVVPTTIVEAPGPLTPADAYTKTTADGRETIVFGIASIAEPYTETTSLAIQQKVVIDDSESAFGLTTLLNKEDEFEADTPIIETDANQSESDTDSLTSYETDADQDGYETDGEY